MRKNNSLRQHKNILQQQACYLLFSKATIGSIKNFKLDLFPVVSHRFDAMSGFFDHVGPATEIK